MFIRYLGIPQGDVARQQQPPFLYVIENGIVNPGGALLALGGFCKPVECPLPNCLTRENSSDLIPLFNIIGIAVKTYPAR